MAETESSCMRAFEHMAEQIDRKGVAARFGMSPEQVRAACARYAINRQQTAKTKHQPKTKTMPKDQDFVRRRGSAAASPESHAALPSNGGAWTELAPCSAHRGPDLMASGQAARLTKGKAGSPRLVLAPWFCEMFAIDATSTFALACAGKRLRLTPDGPFTVRRTDRKPRTPSYTLSNAVLVSVLSAKGCITYRAQGVGPGTKPAVGAPIILEPISSILR